MDTLVCYSQEFSDTRIQPNRLPEILQIVMVFLENNHELPCAYGELFLDIIFSSDSFGKHNEVSSAITPEQFRLETAKIISNLSQQWGKWSPSLQSEANQVLDYLERLAHKANDLQQFTTICRDMALVIGLNQNMSPAIGFKVALSLMGMSRDFHEFESYIHRINAQIKLWRDFTGDMFLTPKTISELHQSLVFLETIIDDARRIEYVRYVPTKDTAEKNYNSFVRIVQSAYIQQVWKKTSEYDTIIEDLCRKFEENVVCGYLGNTWNNLFASTRSRYSPRFKVRWEFDKFTAYVPYNERARDWTEDSARTRRYWNWRITEKKERYRFIDTFTPRFQSLLKAFKLPDVEKLFRVFPIYLSTQEFQKEVYIPVVWDRSVEWQEGYDKYVGFYAGEVEVARPSKFAAHTFTFERPYLQNAIELLDNEDKIRKFIQSPSSSRD